MTVFESYSMADCSIFIRKKWHKTRCHKMNWRHIYQMLIWRQQQTYQMHFFNYHQHETKEAQTMTRGVLLTAAAKNAFIGTSNKHASTMLIFKSLSSIWDEPTMCSTFFIDKSSQRSSFIRLFLNKNHVYSTKYQGLRLVSEKKCH